jgi:hypothetical protein
MAIADVAASEVVLRLTALEKPGVARAPGTGFPGRVALGTCRRRGGTKDFIADYRGRPAVIIDLDQDMAGYGRLIVSVDSPDDVQRL